VNVVPCWLDALSLVSWGGFWLKFIFTGTGAGRTRSSGSLRTQESYVD
jgi:hypothetical protein